MALKKIAAVILLMVISGLFSLHLNSYAAQEYSVVREETGMDLLKFLNDRISVNNTVDEIMAVFEEMCQTPIRDELLLLECGVYNYTGQELFYFDMVRQYPDGEGEYYQLRVSLAFLPDNENCKLNDTLWSDDTTENFFDYARRSSGYQYAKNKQIHAIDIRVDQT